MEEEVGWCGGALLVTLFVIYLEFKAHQHGYHSILQQSHLDCALWDYHLFFNRKMTQHTSRLCKG
jgi:hypothetical protein